MRSSGSWVAGKKTPWDIFLARKHPEIFFGQETQDIFLPENSNMTNMFIVYYLWLLQTISTIDGFELE